MGQIHRREVIAEAGSRLGGYLGHAAGGVDLFQSLAREGPAGAVGDGDEAARRLYHLHQDFDHGRVGGRRLVGSPRCDEVGLDEYSGPRPHVTLDPAQQIQALPHGSIHSVLLIINAFDDSCSVH